LASLTGKYGEGLTSEFKVNPDLIGGVRVHVGSDVYDGSVRGRLARLKSTFSK
jgi:F-type H+-transporting ATPase subunit delta